MKPVLQPSGAYKPVERFCEFINVPELIDMFRSVADVVLKDDLRFCLTLPRIKGGHPQITLPISPRDRVDGQCQHVKIRGDAPLDHTAS